MLFCLVFIRFRGQSYQKPTENEVKVEENIPHPFDKFKKEHAELWKELKMIILEILYVFKTKKNIKRC